MGSEALKLRIDIGQNQFVVNCAEYTYERVVDLSEKVSAIRRNHSIFSRFPLEEGETREKWRERIEPLLEKESIRKDGESVDDHLKRLYDSKVDSHEIAFEVVNAIAEVFKLKTVEEPHFKQTNWLKMRAFIYDVLNMGDIPADDFFPKRPSI